MNPIYGKKDPKFFETITPGAILSWVKLFDYIDSAILIEYHFLSPVFCIPWLWRLRQSLLSRNVKTVF